MSEYQQARGAWFRGVGRLLVALLVVAALVAWHRAEQLADELGQRQAIEVAPEPVRGPLTSVEVNRLVAKVTPALVDVETTIGYLGIGGAGSGIVLSPNGEVLTNNHVISGATTVEVVTKSNQRRYKASVIGYDRTHDIALLKIASPRRLAAADLGDSSSVRPGEPILGIGNAGGAGGKPIRAPGMVKALNKSIVTSDEVSGSTERLKGLIEVLADVRPGDSGGPLVDEAGQVVGVDTAASVNFRTNVPNGIGYAIPINDALGIVRAIRAGRSTDEVHVGPTGTLGIAVTGPAVLSDGTISRGAKPGATVTTVSVESAAQDAGLARGDTIVGMDGTPVDSPARLTAIVGRHRPGDRLTMDWVDAYGQRHNGAVTLDEGPPA